MEYISREEWGPIPMKRKLVPLRDSRIEGIVLHHTTGSSNDPVAMTKQHDRHHVNGRGWSTIAYNWLIGNEGEIIEGRGWHVGGATKNWNSKTVSISFVGDGDNASEKALSAINTVISMCREKYGDLWVKCHRDFKATYCPSDKLALWVSSGREANASEAASKPAEGAARPYCGRVLSKRRKSRGEDVEHVQKRLNELGFNCGKVDGKYGPRTADSVKSFQKSRAYLSKDGVVGAKTWHALFNK